MNIQGDLFSASEMTSVSKQATSVLPCNRGNVEAKKILEAFEKGKTVRKTMTVKEVAEALGVTERTVQRHIKAIRSNLDHVVGVKNGVQTLVSEAEVTLIKKKIELSGRSDAVDVGMLPKTRLEKQLLIRQAIQLQDELITELEAENEQLKLENAETKPKADYYDALVDKSAATSFRDTAKELGIPERKFIEALLADKYVYQNQKRKLNAYARFIQEGLFTVKEWQAADRTGVQTLVTVKGKQLFLTKYKHFQNPQAGQNDE